MARNRKMVPPLNKSISILNDGLYSSGRMRELTPNMSKRLKILDPTILPMAISAFFFIAATTEVASSGREVPAATMVKPMIFF